MTSLHTTYPSHPLQAAVVLGAAGFIGRHVCRSLNRKGHIVRGLGHGDWSPEEWSGWGLQSFLRADVGFDSLQELCNGVQPVVFINCAGGAAVARSYSDPLADFNSSVGTTATLLEFVRRRGAGNGRVVVASSAAVYGDHGNSDLYEDTSRSPISPYGIHKVMSESLCEEYSRFFGVACSVVRLFSVYGEGLRKQLLWDALNKFDKGEYHFFGTGAELRDWIHVDDAAELLIEAALARQPDFAVYNGGHIKATTQTVLCELAIQSGTDIVPIFSGVTHTGNPQRLTANCSRAMQLLAWDPQVDLHAGLARYIKWFREETVP